MPLLPPETTPATAILTVFPDRMWPRSRAPRRPGRAAGDDRHDPDMLARRNVTGCAGIAD
jgi:hypothetical protein